MCSSNDLRWLWDWTLGLMQRSLRSVGRSNCPASSGVANHGYQWVLGFSRDCPFVWQNLPRLAEGPLLAIRHWRIMLFTWDQIRTILAILIHS
jgi:hypothetical protein